MVVAKTKEWAERNGHRHEFQSQDGTLKVWLPGSGCEVRVYAFEDPQDSTSIILSMEAEHGHGMILDVPHDGRIEQLWEILDNSPEPMTSIWFRTLRESVFREFAGTKDITAEDDG